MDLLSENQYQSCLQILKKSIKSLDIAIKITEEKDFINKNIELQHESFTRLANVLSDAVLKSCKPLIDNINELTKPMIELSEKLSEITKPFSSLNFNIPNIVLPEIELPKFNIPNYFDKVEIDEENDKNIE